MIKRGELGKREKWLCIFGYALVPVFFVLLYLLMTKTYEDLLQGLAHEEQSVGEILRYVYGYIPRLGEFFQHIATHFMTPQASFGLDMLFRVMTAMFASGIVYLSAVFVCGRRLKLCYKDLIIYLGIFLFYMFSVFSAAFTYRFSDANNYTLALLASVGFLLVFRLRFHEDKWWNIVGVLLLGFCFGISTEIAPIAFLLILVIWLIVEKVHKKNSIKMLCKNNKMQFLAVVGLIIGLVFFYSGAGMGARTGGAYSEMYDYVGLSDLIKNPIYNGVKLVEHAWFNMRYLFFAVPMFGVILLVEGVFYKSKKLFYWQVMLLTFCVLFIGASSLILVRDELYARFMVPVFGAVVLSLFLFVGHILEKRTIRTQVIFVSAIVCLALGVLANIDMTVGFVRYNRIMSTQVDAFYYDKEFNLVRTGVETYHENMTPSLVLRLMQLTPFNWGRNSQYLKFGL